MKLLILAKAAREAISTGRGIPLASLKAAASRSSSMPREGDRIEFRSDRLTDKGPATGEVKTIKATVDGYYLTVEFADGQATLSWDDMGAERVKPGLWMVKSIDAKYQRLLARRTDGTPEAMAAEDARLRNLVERCSGPAAVEAIRAADAETRAKVRADFGMEFASEGGYAAEVIDFHGLQVVIENPVGSVRAGVDPDGKAWATELTASYGYISGTEGADGDMVDVFIGPDATSTTAYVARCQVAGKWGEFDEDKVMLGFPSEEAAREAFLQNYNDPRFLGGLDGMSIEKLKERLGKPGRLAKSILLLSKAHISAYTKKDGTFVPAHDDRRQAAREKDPRPGLPETLEIDGVPRPTRNSKGQPIHPTEEGLRNFWRWFGESQVVDGKGRPLVVYHGGENDVLDFSAGAKRGKEIGVAYFSDSFKVAESYAKTGVPPGFDGEKLDRDGAVTSAYLDIKNPIPASPEDFFDGNMDEALDFIRDDIDEVDVDALQSFIEDNDDESFWEKMLDIDYSTPEISQADDSLSDCPFLRYIAALMSSSHSSFFRNKMKGKYDGMIFDDAESGGTTYILFRPEQIKSATGNTGAFDPSSSDITKSLPAGVPLLILCKAHVGPYLRGGKLVNLSGYQGRPARARATAGQMGLFSDLPPAEKPKRKKADYAASLDHDTTGDLFADADEHGEVPPGRRLMPRRDTVTESRQELIAEHEHLVDVLRSPSHEDDKEEAKKQAAELAEYKAGEHDHLLADIPGAKWKRGKGRIAGHYGVEVGGEVLGNFHEKPEDAVAAAKEWMSTRAAQKAEAEKRTENITKMRERLLAGGEATDMDLKLLGLRQGAAGLEWFIPAAAEAFGISSRAVRPYIKDMISIGHTINGVKKEFVPPKKALQAIADEMGKAKPVLLLTSERKSANAQNSLTTASSRPKVEVSEPSDTARRESGAQEKKMSKPWYRSFKEWYDDADMPEKQADGTWVDLETGLPFIDPASFKEEKPVPEKKRADAGMKLDELRDRCARLVKGQAKAIDRAKANGLNPEAIAAAEAAVAEGLRLLQGKAKKADFQAHADLNAEASRKLNAAHSGPKNAPAEAPPKASDDVLAAVDAALSAVEPKPAKAEVDPADLVAPAGYALTRENGEIVLRGPWSDDLHARLKRAGGKWEGSGHGTGRVGRKAWIIPENKASSLKRIFANVGGALAAEDASRKAAAQAEAEQAAAAKAEADRKQAEARAAAPTITPGRHGPFTVRAVSGGYRIMFPYDSARVAQIKANGGKKYDPVDRSWFVDAADAGKLQSILDRAKAAAAAAPAAPASSAAPVSARKPRVLFPLSTMPSMGVPVTWHGRTVVFESRGEPFRINEDHPSMHGSHLLGHEGGRGAYAYYRDATPEEVQGMQAAKNAPAEKSWAYSSDAVKRALEGRD